jgi:hypothetical protein
VVGLAEVGVVVSVMPPGDCQHSRSILTSAAGCQRFHDEPKLFGRPFREGKDVRVSLPPSSRGGWRFKN